MTQIISTPITNQTDNRGSKDRKPAKRPWAKRTTTHSVRLTAEETRMLGELVRKRAESQSRVMVQALRHFYQAVKKAA